MNQAMHRRTFLRHSSLFLIGTAMAPARSMVLPLFAETAFESKRPPVEKRTFLSEEVEETIRQVKALIADEELAWLFENCYPNTLDTTVDFELIDGKPDTFIITGDIDAMWLRDSTAQVWPYLPLINRDPKLKQLVAGLINRQAKCVLLDPYANAFYKDFSRVSEWNDDKPTPIPGVHERKWEVDSLCYVVRLAARYYELTGDTGVFDEDWDRAMRLIVQTFRVEQRKDGTTPYAFVRKTTNMIDAAPFNGKGRPIKPTGLICSAFRPSDDAADFPFLIPSNIFAALSLRQLAGIYQQVLNDAAFARECSEFAAEVEEAVKRYAISKHLDFGRIYAYEVDGFGNRIFMDDANVPSLMSLAYLDGRLADDPIYQNTRKFLLSDANPYFLKGQAAEGQASPHTGKERIWPMGIILRTMTAREEAEVVHCLRMLKNTHAGTGFMHESFHKDDPADYTRSWFAWANTLFGELVIKVAGENPGLLREKL